MRKVFLLLLGVCALSAPALADDKPVDHQGVGPAPIEGMQMSQVVGQEEFQRMQANVQNEPSEKAWGPLWYCVAQSGVTGNWYYWYSFNAYYARNQALGACVAVNGYTCNVGCQISY